MDSRFIRGSGRPGGCRVPCNYFGEYFSPGFASAPEDSWVTGRFSPQEENILFIGSDTGHVCVVDVDASSENPADAFKYYFRAHPGVVMDLIPVPGCSEELLTMSGYDIRIWTLGSPVKSSLFMGHDKSVRCASFAPDNSHVFSTGGRDGCIYMWDRRMAPLSQNNQVYRRPAKEYRNCHLIKSSQPLTPSGRRRSDRISLSHQPPPSITSMVYLDEHTLITSSSSGKSGIRLWDTRKMPIREESKPMRTLELPYTQRDAGVSSICLDRFKSSLFAVSTDNCIYEFSVNSSKVKPVRSYVGACIDADFYIQMACSPISDHIICGSGDKRALMWDAQDFHTLPNSRAKGSSTLSPTGIRPVLSLGGHEKKVSNVGYSANGAYMLTMDDSEFRIWRRLPVSRSSLKDAEEAMGTTFERVERVEVPKEDTASSVLESFSITPGPRLFLSPTKAGMAPLQKRKEPFTSPFKKCSTRLFSDEKENIPPGVKLAKLDDVRLPRLEVEEEGEKKEERRGKEDRKNPFYYKYPTMHLPNLIYERYVDRLKGEGKTPVEVESVTKSGRKVRTLECWARSSAGRLSKERLPSIEEFPDSACAQMLTPITPKKLSLRPLQPATTAAVVAAKGPRRSTARNILDYFQTNKATGDKE